MKRYNPQETMPDEGTEVLAYFSGLTGFIVVHYDGDDWLDSWGESFINGTPEYWIDLTDLERGYKSNVLHNSKAV